MYSHQFKYITAGADPLQAIGAVIMLHGRGSSAQNIISLANELDLDRFAIYAPQATHNSWYPYSFLAPETENQPALSSALDVIEELVKEIQVAGIPPEQIYFMGFSQGACLTLEYVGTHAKTYGGAVAFTGGLIGENLKTENYTGDLGQTPVLITTGDPDPHVPINRVEESVRIFKNLDADVTLKVYKGRPHTITQEEINLARQLVFKNS